MNALTLAILALAVFRLSHMLAREEGPFEVFTRLRTWIFHVAPGSWMERGLSCPMCLSFWLGMLAAPLAFWLTAPWWLWWPLVGLALSAVTVIIQKVTR